MALAIRIINRNCRNLNNLIKPVKCINVQHDFFARTVCSRLHDHYQSNVLKPLTQEKHLPFFTSKSLRPYSTQESVNDDKSGKKVGIIQKFKQMYRDYWYVLLPVHMTTSAIWFGCFYYAVKSGVDVIGLLEWLGISEKLISPLKESKAGYFALALALYKLITPLRYAATVGVTTMAIRKLTSVGLIKPVPSRERIKEMIQERKESFQESKQHYHIQMKEKKTQVLEDMKEKKSKVLEEMKRYKEDIRKMKNGVKKM